MKSVFNLTLADIEALKPRSEIFSFAKACGGDMRKFWETCPDGNWLLWLLRKTGNLTESEDRQIGLAYGQKVLPVFEQYDPDDKRPRLCLEAIEKFLNSPSLATREAMFASAFEAETASENALQASLNDLAPLDYRYASKNAALALAKVASDYPRHSEFLLIWWDYFFDADCAFRNHKVITGSDFDPAARTFAEWSANKIRAAIKLHPVGDLKKIHELTMTDLEAMNLAADELAFVKSCGGDMQKIWGTCPNGDWLIYLLKDTGNLNEMNLRRIGLSVGRGILPIFEKSAPADDRPRLCVKALEEYLANPTDANRLAMYDAAWNAQATYAEMQGVLSLSYSASVAAHTIYTAAVFGASNTPAGHQASNFAPFAVRFGVADPDAAQRAIKQWGADKIRSIIKPS